MIKWRRKRRKRRSTRVKTSWKRRKRRKIESQRKEKKIEIVLEFFEGSLLSMKKEIFDKS